MAWTTPRTWADGLEVTATILNTEIRDNLDHLSTHVHDGSAGSGPSALSGLDTITFDDVTAPAAPGSAKGVVYSVGGKLHQRSGSAGVDTELEVVGHSHTLTQTRQGSTEEAGATGVTISRFTSHTGVKFFTDQEIVSRSDSYTIDRYIMAAAYVVAEFKELTGCGTGVFGTFDVGFRLIMDGVVADSESFADPAAGFEYTVQLSGLLLVDATVSKTVTLAVTDSDGSFPGSCTSENQQATILTFGELETSEVQM